MLITVRFDAGRVKLHSSPGQRAHRDRRRHDARAGAPLCPFVTLEAADARWALERR
jgi:hypothetical protein